MANPATASDTLASFGAPIYDLDAGGDVSLLFRDNNNGSGKVDLLVDVPAKFIELADAKLDDYLQRLDQSDAAESTTGGSRVANLAEKIAALRSRRTRCQGMLAELDRTGEDQISLTDPDSRAMAAHTRVAVGYNMQVAVDTKHKLIVEQ